MSVAKRSPQKAIASHRKRETKNPRPEGDCQRCLKTGLLPVVYPNADKTEAIEGVAACNCQFGAWRKEQTKTLDAYDSLSSQYVDHDAKTWQEIRSCLHHSRMRIGRQFGLRYYDIDQMVWIEPEERDPVEETQVAMDEGILDEPTEAAEVEVDERGHIAGAGEVAADADDDLPF